MPLTRDEDIINNWVNLIEEGRPEETAQMMKISDSSPPQATVNFKPGRPAISILLS